jgi:diacylglycerol kinase family enzyme
VALYDAAEPSDLSRLTKAALVSLRHRKGGVVVAGGDGTINTVARVMLHHAVPLTIIPCGTFNYVARALHIPLDPLAAAALALDGVIRAVHVGTVNGHVYLNNASIGLYPHLIEQREADKSRFGRYQSVAMLSGFAVLMRQHQKMRLKMIVDGQTEKIDTPMVFFGNNQLQLADMHLALADCASAGRLAAVAMTDLNRIQVLSLIARMQLGTFEQAPQVRSFCADHIRIESRSKYMKLAIDGEIVRVNTPLHFQVARHALQVMTPHASTPV